MTETWKRAIKKPVVIEYREVNGEKEDIKTREGVLTALSNSDFVIKGVEGELCPITKTIFKKTYETLDSMEDTTVIIGETIECYTCCRCHVFFDRENKASWKEPVELDKNTIYCKECSG